MSIKITREMFLLQIGMLNGSAFVEGNRDVELRSFWYLKKFNFKFYCNFSSLKMFNLRFKTSNDKQSCQTTILFPLIIKTFLLLFPST